MPTMSKDVLVVVADGVRARLFRSAAAGATPAEETDVIRPTAHGHARDLKSDKPGRGFAAAGADARHGMAPHHDYHRFEKALFAGELARLIAQADADNPFGALILVAPPQCLGDLRHALSEPLRHRIVAEVGKDLTKHTAASLASALAPHVPAGLLPVFVPPRAGV